MVLLFAVAALAAAAGCSDIEVAGGGGGQDDARDGTGGGGDTGVVPSDGAGPPDDTGGPGPDAGGADAVAPDDTPVVGNDTPVGPDTPIGRDIPVEPDTPAPRDAGEDTAPLPCLDQVLDPAWGPALVTPFTLEGDDSFAGSCGGAGSKDFAYGWVVPFTDWFTIDTAGSDFDTVLYILGRCEGPEVECNNDVSTTDDTSRIVRHFEEGDRGVIVLDGNSGSSGNAVLNIQPVRCPSGDVGDGATLPQEYSTATGTNEHGGACGGDGGPERTFRFTPPEDGLWRISATTRAGDTLQTALYLERGPVCGGPLLQCNGHDQSAAQLPTEVTRFLPGGAPVTIVVDTRSGEGRFTLKAERVGAACPDVEWAPELALDINAAADVMTTSCGENASVEFNFFTPYPDILVSFEDLEPGAGAFCMADVTAGFPFSMAVVRAECAGAELSCGRVDLTEGDGRYHQTANFPQQGGRFMVVVSPIRPEWGGWADSMVNVNVMCAAK